MTPVEDEAREKMAPLHEHALILAREIAADSWYPLRHDDDYIYARERILCGDMDHTVQVQSIYTAVLRTTELAAKLADSGRWNRAYCASPESIADALRNGEHLTKAPTPDAK